MQLFILNLWLRFCLWKNKRFHCKGYRWCECAYQGLRNVCFLENLACSAVLLPPFWDSPFCLITYDLVPKAKLVCQFVLAGLSQSHGKSWILEVTSLEILDKMFSLWQDSAWAKYLALRYQCSRKIYLD